MTPDAHYETLFHRYERNPILTAADWPYPVHTVFNAAATRLQDGTTLLLCRVEDRTGLSLALTTDFREFERYGLVMQPDDKDAALLPRRINGQFALLHRPATPSSADVWMSFSPDLRNWGGHRRVLESRRG